MTPDLNPHSDICFFRQLPFEIRNVTYSDLCEATVVTHWGYRERRPSRGKDFFVLVDSWRLESESYKVNYIQDKYAKMAGRRPDNHSMALVRLASGEEVYVYFSDGRLSVMKESTPWRDF